MVPVTTLALGVLMASDPLEKVIAARKADNCRKCAERIEVGDRALLPDRPARPEKPALTEPGLTSKRRPGSEKGRIALIHALAHIELNAIDLAFDMAARFAGECSSRFGSADDFIEDWIRVGAEEAEHFELLENRLRELGSWYGALSAHDGLWQAATATRDNWAARLAVVPMVLEARGLDVTPSTVSRLRDHGDNKTADILEKIYQDEIGHVQIGVKWFTRICQLDGVKTNETFKSLVENYFKGQLKPPFNEAARTQAGLLPNFYRYDAL